MFTSNFAEESGGAIYWGDVEPEMGSKLIFKQNLALIYANDVGSIPAKMVSINATQYNNQLIRADSNKNQA